APPNGGLNRHGERVDAGPSQADHRAGGRHKLPAVYPFISSSSAAGSSVNGAKLTVAAARGRARPPWHSRSAGAGALGTNNQLVAPSPPKQGVQSPKEHQ